MWSIGQTRRAPRERPPNRSRRLSLSALALTAALGLGLTACANGDAHALVVQACRHVTLSLSLYRRAQSQTDAAMAERQRNDAEFQLQLAAPLAAVAAGQAPQWQALMATLSETSRLPESDLVPALTAQCAAAQNGGALIPNTPATTLPPAPGVDTTLPAPPKGDG